MTKQLELPLWEMLRDAQLMPEQADFEELLEEVEEAISQVPESDQLRLAGEAFLLLTEVYATRSEIWMEEWEQASKDPVVERGFFDDLVRQTMAVDLSELIEPAPPRKQQSKREVRQEGSIVAAVEKEAVLAMVEQMEEEEEKKEVLAHPEGSALLCAHDENVSAWIEAIQQWLRMSAAQSVSLADLYNHLKMPWIEVWMGVLLGSFELEQQGELYRTSVWVKMR